MRGKLALDSKGIVCQYLPMKVPLEKRRKGGLGHYNASREEWQKAYRQARIDKTANPKNKGIYWKAGLIVEFERESLDSLHFTAKERLAMNKEAQKVIDEILAENA